MNLIGDEKPRGMVLRHMVGLILFPAIGFVVAILWLMFVTKVLGIGQTGFGLAAVVVVLPIYAIGFGVLAWLPIWILYDRKKGQMSSLTALIIGLVTGFILVLVVAGFRSFGPAPGAQYFGWALLAMTTIGGWSHNKILNP